MATREEVVQSLKGLARARQPLNFAAVRKARGKLVSAALKHFPSWDQALVAAGLEPQRLHRAPS